MIREVRSEPGQRLAELEGLHQLARVERRGIRGGRVHDPLGDVAELGHRQPELRVPLRVQRAELGDLAPGPLLVPPARQRAPVEQRREGAVERDELEPEARQVELADDVGPEQADDVGADREGEARVELLAHRRAAQDVAPLEHEHLAPGPGQVGGAGEAVVAAADDDRVVVRARWLHGFLLRGGS